MVQSRKLFWSLKKDILDQKFQHKVINEILCTTTLLIPLFRCYILRKPVDRNFVAQRFDSYFNDCGNQKSKMMLLVCVQEIRTFIFVEKIACNSAVRLLVSRRNGFLLLHHTVFGSPGWWTWGDKAWSFSHLRLALDIHCLFHPMHLFTLRDYQVRGKENKMLQK